jgi:polyphosphate kinase 2 (PPK2 family)
MATFDGGSFHANGSAMASMTTASLTTDMIASMTKASVDKDTTIATHANTIKDLETSKIQLTADLATAQGAAEKDAAAKEAEIALVREGKDAAEKDAAAKAATIKARDATIMDLEEKQETEKMPTWAIAIIIVIGAMFLLVLVILGVVVSR